MSHYDEQCNVRPDGSYYVRARTDLSPALIRTPASSYIPWIEWSAEAGAPNVYPYFLEDMRKVSPIHATALQNKMTLVAGDMLFADSSNELKRMATEALISKIGLSDIWMRVVSDYEMFNGFALLIRYNRQGLIAAVEHLDFANVRMAREGHENKPGYRKFFFSPDWGNVSLFGSGDKRNTPKCFLEFNPDFFDYEPEECDGYSTSHCQILWHANYFGSGGIYPMPSYVGAMTWIRIENEIANFQLNSVRRGYHPAYFLQIVNDAWGKVNNLSPDAARHPENRNMLSAIDGFSKRFADRFAGVGNAGGVMLQTIQDKEHQTIVTPMTNNVDSMTLMNNLELARSCIITAHQFTSPTLAGLSGGQQLGGASNELRAALAVFVDTYILPRQTELLSKINGLISKIIGPQNAAPVLVRDTHSALMHSTEAERSQILTINERRKSLGVEPIPGGDIIGAWKSPVPAEHQTNTAINTK
jgi:hypothetical protein